MATRSKVVEFGGLDIICNTIAVGATKPGQAGTVLSGSEIVVLDSVTPGTVAASKAVVVDSSKAIAGFTNVELNGPVGTGAASASVLELNTNETTVVITDQLGRIDFAAPLEASGSDAILVGASIWAEAGDTFTATVNDTDLVFALGVSETATEKARLTSAGVFSTTTVVANVTGNVTGDSTGMHSGGHTRTVVADAAFASPVALTVAQSGSLCVFDETAGSIFTLPAAAAGLYYDFVIAVASSSNHHRVACTSGDFLLGSVMIHATDDTGLSSAHAANGSTHLAIQLDADTVGRLAGGKFRVTAISGTQWVIHGDLLGTGTIATPFETS